MTTRCLSYALAAAMVSLTAAAQTLPASIDWREKGAVTPVKNMGQCGASYGFAATAAVEGALVAHGQRLQTLSEQEVVDCSGAYGNQGCNGGSTKGALQWVVGHGITSLGNYPYTARDGSCKLGRPVVARITAVQNVNTDVASLMTAVSKQPVAVKIDGENSLFYDYSGGFYGCQAGVPNYWVVIVGYGTDASNRHYWIVKNSEGTGWGEHGYMRMARDCPAGVIGEAVIAVP